MMLLINTLSSNSFSENHVLLLQKQSDQGSRSALITAHLNAEGARSALISSPLKIWFVSSR